MPIQTSWVDLIEWDPNTRSGWIVVRAFIEDGEVMFDGDAIVIEKIRNSPPFTRGESEGGQYRPIEFLESLSKTYRNPYMQATEVRTGKLPKDFGSVPMTITPV